MAELLDAQRKGRNELAVAHRRIHYEEHIAAGWLGYLQVIGRAIYDEHTREQSAQPSNEVGQGAEHPAPAAELPSGG